MTDNNYLLKNGKATGLLVLSVTLRSKSAVDRLTQ